MKLACVVSDVEIRNLIFEHLKSKVGEGANLKLEDIKIKVRSKQNYREKEWETGELQVYYEGDV